MAAIEEKQNIKIRSLGSWVDEKFLEELLSRKLNQKVVVLDYSISAAVPAGENYLSTLYKTQVTYSTPNSTEVNVRHIMIKGFPESEVMAKTLEAVGVFEKECYVYSTFLPSLRSILEEYYPRNTVFVAPEEYVSSMPNVVVMEDLTYDGYQMKIRQDQQDYEHCTASLRTIALLHALSLKLHEKDTNWVTKACAPMYPEACRAHLATFLEDSPKALADEMENWTQYPEAKMLSKKVRRVTPFLYDKIQALELPGDKLNVFNHADLWMNNFMFKYNDDGSIHSVKLVDFQLTRYASPAMDLHYFLVSSTQRQVLSENYLQLIKVYHDALIENCSILQMSVNYSLHDLHEDLKEKAAYGVTVISSVLSFVLAPTNGAVDDGDILTVGEDNIFIQIYRSKVYQKAAMVALRLFEKMGYLEDAVTRVQHIEDAALQREMESNSDEEFEIEVPVEKARERNIMARIKSSVLGVIRKFTDA